MLIWSLILLSLALIFGFAFLVRLAFSVRELAEKNAEQSQRLVDAESRIFRFENQLRQIQSQDDSTPTLEPEMPLATEQAESLRNTALIMEDAASPPHSNSNKWDDV